VLGEKVTVTDKTIRKDALILKPERTENELHKRNAPAPVRVLRSSSSVLFVGNPDVSLRKMVELPRLSAMKEHNSVADSKKMPVQRPSINENSVLTKRQKLFLWLKGNGYSCVKFDAKLEGEKIRNDISSFILPHYPNIKVSLVKENDQNERGGSAS
jgi:hypothetical protein